MTKKKNFIFKPVVLKTGRLYLFLPSIFLLVFFFQTKAQLDHKVDSIGNLILTSAKDSMRMELSTEIQLLLIHHLDEESFYSTSFDSLEYVSSLTSPDDHLRIFSWTVPYNDGTYGYSGVIAHYHYDELLLATLNEGNKTGQDPINDTLDSDSWFGAVYYEMIELSGIDSGVYTLLGWRGVDDVITQKVIDALWFDEVGDVRFGKRIFALNPDSIVSRSIFSYSSEVSMSIKFNPEKDRIIMDHLFPSHPSLKGHFEFYGPDLSFDAFYYDQGLWKFEEDYDPGIRPENNSKKIKSGLKIYEP